MAIRTINFYSQENGMSVWAGEGKVLENTQIIDCPLDFRTDDFDSIYDAISEEISKGETNGSFSNQYEDKYSWEVK